MKKIDIANRVNELNRASEAYYNSDKPIMSDAEFDNKLEELRQLEYETGIVLSNSPTHNVGAIVLDNIPKIKHKTQMLSLKKCHSDEEVEKFANGHNLVGSVKLDGLTVRLTYKDGELIQAESRGDGAEGNLITNHVKQFLNVPLHINKKGTYIIDGEALIKLDDFAEINKNGEYKNSRNLASGTLASLDTSVVKNRRMRWYAWEVVEGGRNYSFYLRLLEANELGFDVVPFFDVTKDQIQNTIDKVLKVANENNLPQDGVVFKFDDVKYGKSLGKTTWYFNNGIAYKVENDSYETTLKNIEFTMGKTGVLTPVAIFDPIEIEGSIVEKASLHNLSVMKDIMGNNPWIGQHIGVYKANLIIPQVRWAEQLNGDNRFNHIENKYLDIPIKCPICGALTQVIKENDSEVLMCTNEDCKGRLLGKLSHAGSRNALNIEGLSETTIEKFIDLGWLTSITSIYRLFDYKEEMERLDGFGKKSVEKLLRAIDESRVTTFDRFLYALSIPMVGKTASKLIAEKIKYNFDDFMHLMKNNDASYFSETIDGIGESIANSLNDYFDKHFAAVFDLATLFEFKNPIISDKLDNSLGGKVFVITGNVNYYVNRDALKADIEAHGGEVSGSISSKTSYLINNDVNSTSSKNQKAKSLNIPIISEDDFLSMIS